MEISFLSLQNPLTKKSDEKYSMLYMSYSNLVPRVSPLPFPGSERETGAWEQKRPWEHGRVISPPQGAKGCYFHEKYFAQANVVIPLANAEAFVLFKCKLFSYFGTSKRISSFETERLTNRPVKDPRPILFTRPDGTESHRLQSESNRGVSDQDRGVDKRSLKVRDEVSETSSFSSLMEGGLINFLLNFLWIVF